MTLSPTSSRFTQSDADGLYIAKALTTTKGDLIAATAASTPARLAVGSDGQIVVADAASSPGVKWVGVVGCRVYNDANISCADGAAVAMTCNQESFDPLGFHSTSSFTARLVVPANYAGYYAIGACVAFAANALGIRYASLTINDATTVAELQFPSAGAVFPTQLTLETVYYLNVADYVKCVVLQNSGGALNVVAQNPDSPSVWCYRVGA